MSQSQATEPRTQAAESQSQATEPRTQAAESQTQAAESQTQATESQTQATEPRTQAAESQSQATEPQTRATEPQTQATGWRAVVRREFPVVLRQEASRWAFILRAALSAFLSLWVAMLLNLNQPSTAMLTALIVMQPQSGAVLAKSLYRMLGNFAGGLFALLLFSLFGQQPVLLMGGMALWVGLCTIGSTRQRNSQSYGFVLAGYTACIIALPEINNPGNIFVPAMLRVSEVFVGILCAAVTAEGIFPESVHSALFRVTRGRFALFDDFVRSVLSGGMARADVEKMQLRFMADVAALDNYGASASFEAGGVLHNDLVRLFNTGFMTASTSFYSLYTFMQRLTLSASNPARRTLIDMCARVAEALGACGGTARTAQEAKDTAAALLDRQKDIREMLAAHAARPEIEEIDLRRLELGEHLLRRFITDMRVYLLQYAALTSPSTDSGRERMRFAPGMDKGIALVSGARAALVLVLMASLWWASAWDDGSGATTFAVVFCALQAAAPNPVRSVVFSTAGCLLATVVGMAYSFLVLPHMTDFPTMCAALFPFLAIGPYLSTFPATSGPGRSYNFMFASFANPGLALGIAPVTLVGGALSKLLGIVFAGAMLAVVFPSGGTWWKNRLRKGLLREGIRACRGKLDLLVPRFESAIRDLLLQFTASSNPLPKEKESMLRQTLAISELGRVVIEIRQGMAAGRFLPEENAQLKELLNSLATLLRRPGLEPFRAALIVIQSLIEKREAARRRDEAALRAAPETAGERVYRPGGLFSLLHILQQALMRAVEELRMLESESPRTGGR